MSKSQRPLAEAERIAAALVADLEPHCTRIVIAGSVRRTMPVNKPPRTLHDRVSAVLAALRLSNADAGLRQRKVHARGARRILVGVDGQALNYQRAKSLLEAVVTVRNAVAHNRYLTNEVYTKGEQNLLALLTILHFDVAKALRNLEVERTPLIRRAIQRLDDMP